MANERAEAAQQKASITSSLVSSHSYEALVDQSKQLGQTAMQAFVGAKGHVPTREKMMSSLTRSLRDNFIGRTVTDLAEIKKKVEQAHEILVDNKTIFPFVFPHEIIIDRSKITIIKRYFFWSKDTVSIRIEDVLNVASAEGPIFGSITLASRVMSTIDHFTIGRFWRKDIDGLKCLIQGYVIARKSGLETDHLSKEELIDTLHELGRDNA